jgi:Fe-S-cluster containining protein
MKKWYNQGLNFKCTGCGKCCTGSSGYVWVSQEEIASIALYLKLDINEFVKKYIRVINGRFSLKEKINGPDFDCIFLKEKQCQVYEVRPVQCKSFPWWKENLISKESWNEASKECEGISTKAPLVKFKTIQQQAALNEANHCSSS